jgi:epoxyqueuosine reductase
LQKGYQGEMRYLENNFDKRLDPRLLVADAKSVISLSYNYFPKTEQADTSYKLAKYAYGQDYHQVLKAKLKELMDFVQKEVGAVSGRAFTDSAPILERAWAEKAGLGWNGKNSLLIQKQHGSFFFLAELILDLELETDLPFKTGSLWFLYPVHRRLSHPSDSSKQYSRWEQMYFLLYHRTEK